jgi:AraC-like DNA-binding protein
MARPQVYYAELNLSGGKIIMRLQDEVQMGMYSWNIPRHTSTDYELHIFAQGTGMLQLDHSTHSVPEGHAVIIGPNTPHSSKSLPGNTVHFYLHFQAEGAYLQNFLRSLIQGCRVFPVEDITILLARQLLKTLCGIDTFRQELLEALLPPIMIQTLQCLGLTPERTITGAVNEEQERRNKIDTFFQSDLPYGNKEERLAQELGISRRHLARILQKYYGMNFRELMLHKRMGHAAWMLSRTDNPVTNIAEALDYTSVSAFSQAFKSVHGKTPTQYRAEHQ